MGTVKINGDLLLAAGDENRYLTFGYNGSGQDFAGYSWRLGYLGSGDGNANYLVIQSGGTDKTWKNAVRFGLTTLDAEFYGNILPAADNTKTLGSSTQRWSNVISNKALLSDGIYYDNGSQTDYRMIRFIQGDQYGAGIVIGGGGLTVIGSGESANNFADLKKSDGTTLAYPGTTETTYITSDGGIEFYTNCDTIANRVGVILSTSRQFYPNANNTGSLGTGSYNWEAVQTRNIYSNSSLYITPTSTMYVDSGSGSSIIFRPQGTEQGRFNTSGQLQIKSTGAANATIIGPGTAGTFYFPNTGGTFVTHATRGTAVGGALKPVYIASTGRATACTMTASGNRWGVLPIIDADGVMELGTRLDFHLSDDDTSDAALKLTAASNTLTLTGGSLVVTDGTNTLTLSNGGSIYTNVTTTGGWARSYNWKSNNNTHVSMGAYGSGDTFTRWYLGTGYEEKNNWLQVTPTTTTVKGYTQLDKTVRIGVIGSTSSLDSNWCEGIRINAPDSTWVTIALGTTGTTNTNTHCWSIHRTSSNDFSIAKNSSDGSNGLVMTGTGMGLGITAPTHRLHVVGGTKLQGTVYLERNKGTSCGRISFYQDTYNSWYEYMSNTAAGSCPTGGQPATLGNVTTWARRSIIENINGYGWVWESTGLTTTAASATTDKPTGIMALSSYNGVLTVTGAIQRSTFPGTWVAACNGDAFIASTSGTAGGFSPMMSGSTTNGRMAVAFYQNGLKSTYITQANCDSNKNTPGATVTLMDESGGGEWPGQIKASNIVLTSTVNGSQTAASTPAIRIGSSDTTIHLIMDRDAINAKATSTTAGTLSINESGGLVKIGTGGLEVAGIVTITRTTDTSATADNGPALIVGGTRTTTHMEIDSNEVIAKSNGTTETDLYLNTTTSKVHIGQDTKGGTTQPVYLKSGVVTAITAVGTAYGGTGITSHTANRIVWSKSATELQAGYHYASNNKIGVNLTSEPSYNFYVNGTSYFSDLVTITKGDKKGIKLGSGYITAESADNGEFVFQGGHLRFGPADWNYNVWGGLACNGAGVIALGLADNVYFKANNVQTGGTLTLPGIHYVVISGKTAFKAYDSWLRINEDGFSSGTYFGSKIVRTDGQFQVGDSGGKFYAKSDGTGYFDNDLKVKGHVFAYNYNRDGNTSPALVFDKPSSNYTGIGSNGVNDTIYFGAVTTDKFEWKTDYFQTWYFNGYVEVAKQFRRVGISSSWYNGRDNAVLRMTSSSGYSVLASMKTTNGTWDIGNYNAANWHDQLLFNYKDDTSYANGNNSNSVTHAFKLTSSGDAMFNGYVTGSYIWTGYNSGVANSISCSNWFRCNGATGLYNASYGTHLMPNTVSSYGGWRMSGALGGYHGILFGDATSAMAIMSIDNSHQGLYTQSGTGWIIYNDNANTNIGIRTSSLTSGYNITLGGSTSITSSLLVSSTVTANKLKISNTSGVAHIEFSRASHNYLHIPNDSGTIALCANATLSLANSGLVVAKTSVYPGETNTFTLGTSSKKWSTVYANTFSGTATYSTLWALTGTANTTTGHSDWDGGVGNTNKYTVYDQEWACSSIGSDTGDLRVFIRPGEYTSGGTEVCFAIDGDYYVMGNKVLHAGNYTSWTDGRYVNVTGDSMTGTLRLGAPYQSTASSRYANAALEIREAGRVGNAQSAIGYAPRIGFHWSNRVAASLCMHSDGHFYFRNQADDGFRNIYAATVTGYGNVVASGGYVWANGGYLYSTANGNEVSIGSQNNSWCHIYNSADIPFIFNRKVFTIGTFGIYDLNAQGVGSSFPANPTKGQLFFKYI